MDKNQSYFLKLILSQLNNKSVPTNDKDIDWKEIYRLSKIHNLVAIVFSAISKLEESRRPEAELYNRFKKEFLLGAHLSMAIASHTERIIDIFQSKKVEHILIKGYVLKDYYPTSEFRSMSDVDILIKDEDRERVHELMLELGYQNTVRDSNVWNYKKKGALIEIHTQLIEEEMKEGADYRDYFSDIWSHCTGYKKAYSYTLEKHYHLIYLFVHMAKHFYSCGCGIRMVMDVAVFIDKFKDELDMKFIYKELDKLELGLFAQNILILCNMYFQTELDFPYELDEKFYEDITSSILLGGAFGFCNSNFRIAKIRNENSEESYQRGLINVFKSMVFPSYEEIVKYEKYAFVKDRKYLLLVAWPYRWYHQLRLRGLGAIGYVGDILSSKNKVKKESETIKKLGL